MPQEKYCCKVGRVADQHNLSEGAVSADLNTDLLERWLGYDEYPETSVRSLADWLNQNLMKTIYREHGRKVTPQYVETDYQALQADDDGRRQDVEYDLKQDEINPDELMSVFISSSTLYRHLTDCLEASKEQPQAQTDWERTKIAFVKHKTADQVRDALQSWENKNELPGATDAEVKTSIYLSCPECPTTVSVVVARDRGYICRKHLGSYDES